MTDEELLKELQFKALIAEADLIKAVGRLEKVFTALAKLQQTPEDLAQFNRIVREAIAEYEASRD